LAAKLEASIFAVELYGEVVGPPNCNPLEMSPSRSLRKAEIQKRALSVSRQVTGRGILGGKFVGFAQPANTGRLSRDYSCRNAVSGSILEARLAGI
jgi:hypothetical protein